MRLLSTIAIIKKAPSRAVLSPCEEILNRRNADSKSLFCSINESGEDRDAKNGTTNATENTSTNYQEALQAMPQKVR